MDDETFAALLASLREGPALIEAQVRSVPAGGWDAPVPLGEGGWSRRQLLAHIAANDLRQLTRVRVGAGLGDAADEQALEAQLQVHAWNQEQVDARRARDVEQLVAEIHAQRRELVALLESLTPEQRSRPMPFRGEPVPLTTMVPVLLEHLAQHARELTL